MSSQTSLSQVRGAILAYLGMHPGAADTAQGIACWWLPESLGGDEDLVSRALDALVAEGLVHRHVNVDRHMIYSSAAKRRPR